MYPFSFFCFLFIKTNKEKSKMTKKYCKGCGKTYEVEDWDVDVDENGPFITPEKPGNTEEKRKFPQMEGKKWTGTKDYMNDYIEPTNIKDIGE